MRGGSARLHTGFFPFLCVPLSATGLAACARPAAHPTGPAIHSCNRAAPSKSRTSSTVCETIREDMERLECHALCGPGRLRGRVRDRHGALRSMYGSLRDTHGGRPSLPCVPEPRSLQCAGATRAPPIMFPGHPPLAIPKSMKTCTLLPCLQGLHAHTPPLTACTLPMRCMQERHVTLVVLATFIMAHCAQGRDTEHSWWPGARRKGMRHSWWL